MGTMALHRDVSLAIRHLVRAPGFAVASILTLAMAIAAATVMASAVRAVLLRGMPMRAPGDVVVAWGSNPSITAGVIELSYLDVVDLGRESRALASAAAVGSSTWPTILEGAGDPIKLAASGVSGAFFDTFGTAAALGRALGPEDDQPGAPATVVLSHALWQSRFGGDLAIVGRSLTFDGQPAQVVGVMPAGFDFPRGTDLWIAAAPVLASAAEGWKTPALRSVGVFYLVGRMRNGVPTSDAGADLSTAATRLPRDAAGITFDVVATPFLDHFYGAARPALWASSAAVVLLLVIACANVSGLMLTRASLASRDAAVRAALGASQWEVAAPWAWEAVVVCGVGGALGWLASAWGMDALQALAPDGVPGLRDAVLDGGIALASLAIIGVTTLACALAPMRQVRQVNAAEALGDGGRTATASRSLRTRAVLQMAQTALAVVLLVATGLVVRSVLALTSTDLGFVPDRVLSLTVEPRIDGPTANAWMADLLERVSQIPGVEASGAVYLRPLALGPIGQGTLVTLEGQPETPEAARANPLLNYQVATPGYFEAMRIPLVRGRGFTAADTAQSPRVTIVSESTAARLWPGRDPIGQRLRTSTFERGTGRQVWREVVGVVRDVRYRGLQEVQLDMYDPATQTPLAASDLIVRTATPLALLPAIEREVRALDPRAIVGRVATLDAIVAQAQAPWRFSAWVFSLFSVLAFGLCAVGLTSLVALDVAHRRQEFAIRSALGAATGAITGGVVKVAMIRVAVGVALGLVAAIGATRAIRGLLIDVAPTDVVTYAGVVALVTLVTVVASYLPARRAATTDPIALLRRE
jgi:predicted permease